jgi:hypothetical protein
MALYLLSYDLRKEGRNYKTLYDELAKFNAIRINESDWCFSRFQTDAPRLRDYFKQFIDSNDALFIAEIAHWASYNTEGTPNDLN